MKDYVIGIFSFSCHEQCVKLIEDLQQLKKLLKMCFHAFLYAYDVISSHTYQKTLHTQSFFH